MKDNIYLWKGLLLFCLLSAYQLSDVTALRQLLLAADDTLEGFQPISNYVTKSGTTRHLRECAMQCQEDTTCNVIAFNDVSKTCSRQRLTLMTSFRPLMFNLTQAPGWRHYRIGSPHCPDRSYIPDRVTGTCYKFIEGPLLRFAPARLDCQSRGEDLLVFEPVAKGFFMFDWLVAHRDGQTANVIVGAKNMGGVLTWLSGNRVDYVATAALWKPAMENNSAVLQMAWYGFKLGTWYDNPYRYICERPFLSSP